MHQSGFHATSTSVTSTATISLILILEQGSHIQITWCFLFLDIPTLHEGLCAAVFPKEKLDTPVEPCMRLIFGHERSSLLIESNNPSNFNFTLNLTCLPCVGVLAIPWHPSSIHKDSHTENPHNV